MSSYGCRIRKEVNKKQRMERRRVEKITTDRESGDIANYNTRGMEREFAPWYEFPDVAV